MRLCGKEWREVWVVDYEFFFNGPGDRPEPLCCVAIELCSGRILKRWQDELHRLGQPPYSIDNESLMVSYYSPAELSCHLALGWHLPINNLDLYPEFRCITNGLSLQHGTSLVGAMAHFGLKFMTAVEKDKMRDLILSGGPWTEQEKTEILSYCQDDVEALVQLLPKMKPKLDGARTLLRGEYMKALARIEHAGVPIDATTYSKLREEWANISRRLVDRVNTNYDVYEDGVFKYERFANFLAKENIPWPRLASGALDLQEKTFRAQAQTYPILRNLHELRSTQAQLRTFDLPVGSDARNRCMLSAFRTKTGRNAPSSKHFIFALPTWIRSLIKPRKGNGLAYIDYAAQEFAIGAVLSRDSNMQEAYCSGDPYLSFGRRAGIIPENGTKKTHSAERDLFKMVLLGVNYGMGPHTLALRIRRPVREAKALLETHQRIYGDFWKWACSIQDYGVFYGRLHTTFGWQIQTNGKVNPRSLRNFPVQANGAEILRLACILLDRAGIRVCAPVHDAVLIEAPLDDLDTTIVETRALMARAGEIVLNGFTLRTDTKKIVWPERYSDKRGAAMWKLVQRELEVLIGSKLANESAQVVDRPLEVTDRPS